MQEGLLTVPDIFLILCVCGRTYLTKFTAFTIFLNVQFSVPDLKKNKVGC